MERSEAELTLRTADEEARSARASRLVELTLFLPADDVGVNGTAADWLFEDVKATWIYGFFSSTILTAAAFCASQLILLTDAGSAHSDSKSLEALAGVAADRGLIDLDLHADLVRLADSAVAYAGIGDGANALGRRLQDADWIGD